MKSFIGVTCAWSVETWGDSIEEGGYYYVGKPYVESIIKQGGIPVLISPEYQEDNSCEQVCSLMDKLDGLLFSGGGDARKFSLELLPSLQEQQPRRYAFESALCRI